MKFTGINDRKGSFVSLKFDKHSPDDVNCGDQIWSDGENVEIADYVDSENLDELIGIVENKHAFKGALRRFELI